MRTSSRRTSDATPSARRPAKVDSRRNIGSDGALPEPCKLPDTKSELAAAAAMRSPGPIAFANSANGERPASFAAHGQRPSQRPSGRVDKPWITLMRYPQLAPTRWLLAHIPTSQTIGYFINLKKGECVYYVSEHCIPCLNLYTNPPYKILKKFFLNFIIS